MPAGAASRVPERFDAVILGGGTAAAMAALSLASAGLRVVSVGATFGPDKRPALEVASPAAARLLAAAGLRAVTVRPCHEIHFRWGSFDVHRRNYLLEPYGPAAFVNQIKLRASLRRAAVRAGAQAWRAQLSRARRYRGQWRLELCTHPEGQTRVVRSPIVVDATGRASRFARWAGARRSSFDHLTAVICELPRPDWLTASDDQMLIESCPDGWWYSAGINGGRLVAVFLTDADLIRRAGGPDAALAAGLRAAADTRSRIAPPASGPLPWRPQLLAAGSSRLRPVMGEGWLAIGDAAIGLDPLAGHGILQALDSALRAADAIRGSRADLLSYGEWADAVWDHYWADRQAAYTAEARWPGNTFWSRRHHLADPPGSRFSHGGPR